MILISHVFRLYGDMKQQSLVLIIEQQPQIRRCGAYELHVAIINRK